MHKLVVWMDENGMAEEDNRPWGELVILAGKNSRKIFHDMSNSEGYVFPMEN